jgi:hypothetical protein
MARQTIEFEITWEGRQKAKLHFLIDNGKVVASDADVVEGIGGLNVEYKVASSPIHRIEWSLWFPGKTLEMLVAQAAINEGEAQELGKGDKETHRWSDEGTARGRAS